MNDKPVLPSLVPKRRHTGLRRLALHVVVLLLVGAALVAGGLRGYSLLKARSDGFQASTRVDTLHATAMELTSQLMGQAAPHQDATAAISRASSARKRSLKQSVVAMVADGDSDSAIAAHVADDMMAELEKWLNNDAQLVDIRAALLTGRDAYQQAVADKVSAALEDVSLSRIRASLSPALSGYALMYYYQALLISGVVLAAMGLWLLYAWRLWPMERKLALARMLEPLGYLLPFFLGVIAFTLYPVVRVILMSFQERFKLDGSFQGWGLGNYRFVLLGVPGTTNYFMQGLLNTLRFVAYTVPLSTMLAIVIAYLLNQKLRFSALFQTAYFLPMVTSITAVGLVWRWIYHKDYGLLNAILSLFGLERIQWLQQGSNSMAVLVIFAVWSSLPFTIILLLSGLQNIDESYYTVARVDGAKAFRIFRRITLPLLAPTVGLVLTINSISAFKVFTEVTVLFNGSPGPAKNLYTVVFYIFEVMRGESLEYGRAAAAAIVLFLLIFLFTMLQRYIQRRWSYT